MRLNARLSALLVATLTISNMPMMVMAKDYANHWAQSEIEEWKDKGVINGYEDGTFKPSKPITKAEFAQILVNVFGYTETEGATKFSDVDSEAWYADAIAKVSAAKIMYEDDTVFNPNVHITREEAAYALANAYKLEGTKDGAFNDEELISSWAQEKVEALRANGGIVGTPEGNFNPQSSLTRAEAVCMLNNINAELINNKGTYSKDVEGNLVVNVRDVVLKDMVIKGNLYLAEGIGDGDIELENVVVEGQVFVEGGGINSIKSRNCHYRKQLLVSARNPVRVVIEGDGVKIEARPGTNVTLVGSFESITVANNVNMTIKDANVGSLVVVDVENKEGNSPVIEIDKNSSVGQVQVEIEAQIKGEGKIDELIVSASKVKVEQKPEKVTVADNISNVTVAGKNESTSNQTTSTKPSGSSSSSNGSSSSGGSGNISKPNYTISGIVSAKGIDTEKAEVVDGAIVKIYEKQENGWKYIEHTVSDAEGRYSVTLPANKNYIVETWVEDENHNGYYIQKEFTKLNKDYKGYSLLMEQYPVANIQVVDKHGNPIEEVKVVRFINGQRDDYSWTDETGYAIRYLWGDAETTYTFKFYVGDKEIMPVEQLQPFTKEEVMEKNQYRKDITVQLPLGVESELEGTVLMPDGSAATNREIFLARERKREDGRTERDNVSWVVTDDQGKFKFENIDTNLSKNERYVLEVRFRDEKGDSYTTESENLTFIAVQANNVIQVKQTYGTKVHVVDKNGQPVPNVHVRLTGKNQYGNYGYGTTTNNAGNVDIHAAYIKPGVHAVTATYGNDVVMGELVIEEGNYNYEMTLKLQKTDINERLFQVEVKGDEVEIRDKKYIPTFVQIDGHVNVGTNDGVTKTKEVSYRSEIVDGLALVSVPKDVHSPRLYVLGANGEHLYTDFMRDDSLIREIDLTNVPSITLSGEARVVVGQNEYGSNLYQATTGASLKVTLKTDIDKEEVALGEFEVDEEGVYAVSNIVPGSFYIFTSEYQYEGKHYIARGYTGVTNANEANYPVTFRPLETVDFKFKLEDGTPLSDANVLVGFVKEETDENGRLLLKMGQGANVWLPDTIAYKDGNLYEFVSITNNGTEIDKNFEIEQKMGIEITVKVIGKNK